MNNIIYNLLSSFNKNIGTESPEKTTKINNDKNINKYKPNINNKIKSNPSLTQGYKFIKYQDKISSKIEQNQFFFNNKNNKNNKNNSIKENFETNDNSSIKREYNKTLMDYNTLLSSIYNSTKEDIDRISPSNNPYLNKYIRFKTGEIYYVNISGVAKKIPGNDVLMSLNGKNGCPPINFVDIDIPWSYKYDIFGEEIPTIPSLIIGTQMKDGQSCGFERSNVYVNSMLNNPQSNYTGCYQENSDNPSMTFLGSSPSSNTEGSYTFSQCETAAIQQGYQFFALQNANETTGIGYCAVSNDNNSIIANGNAYKFIPLWSSNTSGQPVSYAVLSKNGTLTVCDTDGKAYFTTPNGVSCEQVYSNSPNIDAAGNDLGFFTNQTVTSCQQMCSNEPNCNGFVMETPSNTNCWLKAGDLNNLTNNNNRTIYKKTVDTSNCNYFISLQDDGNMCLYKGIPNTSDITNIWCSYTNGKQQESNNNYTLTASKYGMPFLKNDQLLNKGDWVCSENGKLLLIMQNDGNLVLYTFQINCFKNNNNYLGGNLANALYNIGEIGIKSNMSQLGFIDPNSELHKYPASNIKYANNYSLNMENIDITGNDIPNSSFGDCSTVNDCMSACNTTPDCSSFVYDLTGPTPVCKPKNITDIFNTNSFENKIGTNAYIRDKEAINIPQGISKSVNNIDTIKYNNYTTTEGFDLQQKSQFGLINLTSVQKQQLEQLEDRLKQLSIQLDSNNNDLSENNNNLNNQIKKYTSQFTKKINEATDINTKIHNFNTSNNIDNILKETEIKTLQENYRYMLWSILAIIAVLTAINIKK